MINHVITKELLLKVPPTLSWRSLLISVLLSLFEKNPVTPEVFESIPKFISYKSDAGD